MATALRGSASQDKPLILLFRNSLLSLTHLPLSHHLLRLVNTHLTTRPRNSSPHPFPKSILDQPRKNHQILRRPQQLLAHLPPRLILVLTAHLQQLPLLPNTGDCPQEKRANIAGYWRRQRVESGSGGADGGDGAGGMEGEKGEGGDDLGSVSGW